MRSERARSAERHAPYASILGDAFETLHPNVRRSHEAPLTAEGVFDVVHGTHRAVPFLVKLMKLPAAGTGVPVTLNVAVDEPLAVRVDRRIGATRLVTRQRAHGGFLIEENGPGRLAFSLRADGGCLLYEHAQLRFLSFRLPAALSPRVRARVSSDPHGWRVEVTVEWRGHLVCRYGGTMRALQATS